MRTSRQFRSGVLTIQVLVFGSVAVILLTGFVLWAEINLNLTLKNARRTQALAIAEAGIEYYRWHLIHGPGDYWDGHGASSTGPYVRPFYNKDGQQIGTFALMITPPPLGSTIITVESTGTLAGDSSTSKTIRMRLGIPSFAKYSVLTNSNLTLPAGTETYGAVHANGGISFSGLAHNIVSSARTTYDDPNHSGANEYAVHTHVAPTDPLPTSTLPYRSDVFIAGRRMSVPVIDFAAITERLANIKAEAQTNGFYRGKSGSRGYEIVFNTNDTFDLYKVTERTARPKQCRDMLNEYAWGTWSIASKTLLGNYPIPNNNFIFLEDDAWVSGKINSARVTLAAGRFPDVPSQRTSITVNSDLRYTNYDGQDAIGIIAQRNVNVGMIAADTIRIDGALVAQNGRVGRFYYRPSSNKKTRCSPYNIRQSITTYGMIASNLLHGFMFTDGNGYQVRHLNYDPNLLYAPPPGFQLPSGMLEQVSWEELR